MDHLLTFLVKIVNYWPTYITKHNSVLKKLLITTLKCVNVIMFGFAKTEPLQTFNKIKF